MNRCMLLIFFVNLFLLPNSSAFFYCFNQPCPERTEKCDRDFEIINTTSAEVQIHCLDENGEVLKTHVLYKSVRLYKDDYFEDNGVDYDDQEGGSGVTTIPPTPAAAGGLKGARRLWRN